MGMNVLVVVGLFFVLSTDQCLAMSKVGKFINKVACVFVRCKPSNGGTQVTGTATLDSETRTLAGGASTRDVTSVTTPRATQFNQLQFVTADTFNRNRLFVADTYNHVIRAVSLYDNSSSSPPTVGGIDVRTIAGSGVEGWLDGAPASAKFSLPTGVVVNPHNRSVLYVAEYGNHRIRFITMSGDRLLALYVGTIAGGSQGYADGAAWSAQFNNPYTVAVDPNNQHTLYVADFANHCIRMVTLISSEVGNAVSTIAGQCATNGFADGPPLQAAFHRPYTVVVDPFNNLTLYIADGSNNRIRRLTMHINGTPLLLSTVAGSSGSGSSDGPPSLAQFFNPCGLDVDRFDNTKLYVSDMNNHRIRVITLTDNHSVALNVTTLAGSGSAGSSDGSSTVCSFNQPYGLATDPHRPGMLYVADKSNSLLRVVTFDVPYFTLSTTASSDHTATPATLSSPQTLSASGTMTPFTITASPSSTTTPSHTVMMATMSVTVSPHLTASSSLLRSSSMSTSRQETLSLSSSTTIASTGSRCSSSPTSSNISSYSLTGSFNGTLSIASVSSLSSTVSLWSTTHALSVSGTIQRNATNSAALSPTNAASQSQTIPLPPLAAHAFSITAQTTQAVGSAAAVVSVVAGGDVSSANILVLLSTIDCGAQGGAMLSVAARAVSLFGAFGFVAMGLMNVGLFLVVSGLHFLVVISAARWRYVGASWLAVSGGYGLRFPFLSVLLLELLLPPALFGCAAALVSPQQGGSLATFAVAMCLVSIALILAAREALLHVFVAPKVAILDYPPNVGSNCGEGCRQRIYSALMPRQYWAPRELRVAMGTLFTKMRNSSLFVLSGLELWLAVLTSLLVVVTSAFPGTGCMIGSCLLALVFAVAAVYIAAQKPYRLPLDNIAAPVNFGCFSTVCVLKAIAGGVSLLGTSAELGPVQTAAEVLQTIQSVTIGVKVAGGLYSLWQERSLLSQLQQADDCPNDDVSGASTSSMSELFAEPVPPLFEVQHDKKSDDDDSQEMGNTSLELEDIANSAQCTTLLAPHTCDTASTWLCDGGPQDVDDLLVAYAENADALVTGIAAQPL